MKNSSKIVIDILIAIAISLVVNFSHLMLIFVDQDPQSSKTTQRSDAANSNDIRVTGIFSRNPNGHGYLIYSDADTAYITHGRVNRYSLVTGDTISAVVTLVPEDSPRLPIVQSVTRRNGAIVAPYSSNAPHRVNEFVTQTVYYFLLSFVVILVATSHWWRKSRKNNFRMLLFALTIAIILYFFAPLISRRGGDEFVFHLLLRDKPYLEYMIMLKWLFAVIVSLLYSQIYMLMSQRQNMMLENEQLRSESINAQYNMLMNQINPHVLFNSLNPLSMLIRERDEKRSLTYIDRLSYTFRYILQNRESTLTTLAEELSFANAYIYLFKIRYADKLFFDIDIDSKYDNYQIPAFSLQPLLDNAVKHNTIISSRPFHVSIQVVDGVLIVSNDKYPKLEAEPSTGVGLENLSRRWELIAHNPIEVVQTNDIFVVKLPLIRPQDKK